MFHADRRAIFEVVAFSILIFLRQRLRRAHSWTAGFTLRSISAAHAMPRSKNHRHPVDSISALKKSKQKRHELEAELAEIERESAELQKKLAELHKVQMELIEQENSLETNLETRKRKLRSLKRKVSGKG